MSSQPQLLTFAMVWKILSPELILVGAGFLILIIDLLLRKQKGAFAPWLGLLGVLIASAMEVHNAYNVQGQVLPGNVIFHDGFSSMFNLLFLAGTAIALLMSTGILKQQGIERAEYTYLLMFGSSGAMLMASSLDLITLFVGLELLSISTYILVAMRKNHAKAGEGGLKYLIIGSVASALVLYGMSFIYGLSGSTNLTDALQQFQQNWQSYHFLVLISLILILAGLAIKISLVPFHMWAPDTYEGATNPITAYLSVVSKAAAIAMFIRIYLFGFLGKESLQQATPYLIVLAILTMVIGNLSALSQRNIKRILAYSSVAQAGYMLIPVTTLGHATSVNQLWQTLNSTYFYLVVYLFMSFGAFAVVAILSRESEDESIELLQGLYSRSPLLATSMTVFLLSMAGMPFTGGFLGKFYIVMGAIGYNYAWLAAVLFAASVISFYYYFGMIRAMYTPNKFASPGSITVGWSLSATIVVCLIGTIILGILPQSLMNALLHLQWFGSAS